MIKKNMSGEELTLGLKVLQATSIATGVEEDKIIVRIELDGGLSIFVDAPEVKL